MEISQGEEGEGGVTDEVGVMGEGDVRVSVILGGNKEEDEDVF